MGEPKHILLAEDDPRDAELILQGLAAAGLDRRVTAVGDGAAALDYLFGRGAFAGGPAVLPALLLLDLKMPKLNGLDVLREVRASDALAGVPVVMLSSSRETSDIDAAYRLGANAFIVKPLGFRDFIDTVKAVGVFWGVINEPPNGRLARLPEPGLG